MLDVTQFSLLADLVYCSVRMDWKGQSADRVTVGSYGMLEARSDGRRELRD